MSNIIFLPDINRETSIDAVEIDAAAFKQAQENFEKSPWKERLTVFNKNILQFEPGKKYDCIISNPPFFENDLKSSDNNKNNAKHDTSLTLEQLLTVAKKHLNDDGIFAPGIKFLSGVASKFGRIVVVAPDKPQSGMGHAITIGEPLRLHRVHNFGDVEAYSCSGTPVDCVKLAVDKVLHRKPDICISGINHGANHSINVIYSGTMSAALEASIESIPSIGFSLLDLSIEADFTGAKQYARIIVEQLLASKNLDKHICLNVNIPKVKAELINGIKKIGRASCRERVSSPV